jgi:hypothetical protein
MRLSAKISGSAVIIILAFLATSCENNKPDTRSSSNLHDSEKDSLVITLFGYDGRSVLELTQEKHKVDFIKSYMGVFIRGIDSVYAGDDCGWLFSVNDSFVQVAADAYITNNRDLIKWHYRKF